MHGSIRRYRITLLLSLVLALVFLVAAAVGSSRAATTSFQAQSSRVASVRAMRSVSVGDSARSSHVGLRRVSIARFTATPSALSASGGKVRLQAVVHGATKCRFWSATTLKGLPSIKGCTSGKASLSVKLPANTTSSTKTYSLGLTARGAGRASTRRVIVVERAATRAEVAPVNTTQPSPTQPSQAVTYPTPDQAGYEAAPGGVFSAVSASWTVPTATCQPGMTSEAVQWPGIGDAASVVQDGTQENCNSSGTPSYVAWYELYGDPLVTDLGLPSTDSVAPGDVMTGAISISGSTWTLTLTDATRPWTWTLSTPNTSPGLSQASAEVFVECPQHSPLTPSCPSDNTLGTPVWLTDFGAVRFTAVTADVNGQTSPITDLHPVAEDMTNGSTLLAAPGPLDPEGDFTDTWYAN
jgi:Peptidase A4 family